MFAPTFGVDALLGELNSSVENDEENSNVQLLKRLQRRCDTQRHFCPKIFFTVQRRQLLLQLPLRGQGVVPRCLPSASQLRTVSDIFARCRSQLSSAPLSSIHRRDTMVLSPNPP